MNIISEKEEKGRLLDGIDTILQLSDEDFDFFIKCFEPKSGEDIEIVRFYYLKDPHSYNDRPLQIGVERQVDEETGYTIYRDYYLPRTTYATNYGAFKKMYRITWRV